MYMGRHICNSNRRRNNDLRERGAHGGGRERWQRPRRETTHCQVPDHSKTRPRVRLSAIGEVQWVDIKIPKLLL